MSGLQILGAVMAFGPILALLAFGLVRDVEATLFVLGAVTASVLLALVIAGGLSLMTTGGVSW